MMKPKASVLMPVYNAEDYLADAINSIIHQEYIDYEFIIVNDGSADSSQDIIDEFAAEDSRIHVIKKSSNTGIVDALNEGLHFCRGEYVVRMDADDISTPDRLSKQIAVIDDCHELVVLGGSVDYIDASGQELNVVRECNTKRSLLYGNPLLHPTVIIRKRALDDFGICYVKKYLYAEDYFLWLSLSRKGKIDAIPDVVVHYRLSKEATRVRKLRNVIIATIKAKWDGVFKLGIKPTPLDIVRFAMEGIMLLLPVSLIFRLYVAKTFGNNSRINL